MNEPFDPAAVPLEGLLLVEASAGTGKTFAITQLYARLVREQGCTPAEIVVVTYTRAATAELRARIRRRLRSDAEALPEDAPDRRRLETALRSFDDAAITTIHGFCQRVLVENALEVDWPPDGEVLTEERLFVEDVALDRYARTFYENQALVEFVASEKQGPETFVRIAHRAVATSDAAIGPADTGFEFAQMSPLLARIDEARMALTDRFRRERTDIEAVLLHSDRKKTIYTEKVVAKLMSGFEAWLQDRGEDARAELIKLTPARVANGTRIGRPTPNLSFFIEVEQFLVLLEPLARKLPEVRATFARDVRRDVERRKVEAGVVTYDDLLRRLRDALTGPNGSRLTAALRRRYRAALVDEFQDTDPVQYEIFRHLFGDGERPLFLIGDPKQSIYGFRGADRHTYARAVQDAGRTLTLPTNYRSDPAMIAAVNGLFTRDSRPFLVPGIEFRPVQPAAGARQRIEGPAATPASLRILWVDPTPSADGKSTEPSVADIAARVATEIVRTLGAGYTLDRAPLGEAPRWTALEPSDFVVLCRTNVQCRTVQEQLRRRGVPTVFDGDEHLLLTEDAEEMERVLTALADPTDAAAVRAALVTRILGLDGVALEHLARNDDEWDLALTDFHDAHRCGLEEGCYAAIRTLFARRSVHAGLLARSDGERRYTNVQQLAELLHETAVEQSLGLHGLLSWFRRSRADAANPTGMASEGMQVRLESDGSAVRLTTIHRSKGLEFPWVVLPFPWSLPLAHDSDQAAVVATLDDGSRVLDLGTELQEERLRSLNLDLLAENVRLLYVALTRAKHRVDLVWGPVRPLQGSAAVLLMLEKGATAGDALADVAARISSLNTKPHLQQIQSLAAALHDVAVLEPLGPFDIARFEPERAPTRLAAQPTQRRHLGLHRTTSFTALVRGAPRTEAADVGKDVDALEGEAPPQTPVRLDGVGSVVPLATFPAGAGPGVLVHAIFEELDFQAPSAERRRVVERILDRFGEDRRWTDPLTLAIDHALDAPLNAQPSATPTIRLRDIPLVERLNEVAFLFRVGPSNDQIAYVTAARLARVFRRHDAPAEIPAYADRLQRMGFQTAGFLEGVIDLVFRHDGRYHLVDYKSSYLGPSVSDYDRVALAEAMTEHDYVLQYHLYAVALHRHLRVRSSTYDYDRHFGGVHYLFLRGMVPGSPECGVFYDRPSKALIEDLDATLDSLEAER